MKAKIFIPLVTLCLGFIPMLIMSILTKTFWIDSQYNEPFVLIPAFLIGDSLLLPILNYHIYLALMKVIHFLEKKTISLMVFYSFLISIMLNSFSHYVWIHDDLRGVLDPKFGIMSFAGWWHYGFSVLQFTILFTFAAIWIVSVKQQNHEMFKTFEKATYVLLVFNLVNMSGLFINSALVSKGIAPNPPFISVMTALTPIIVVIALLFTMRVIYRSKVFPHV